MRRLLCPLLLIAATGFAQSSDHALRLVLATGSGAIPVHLGDGWSFETIHVFPDGPRPVLQTNNEKSGMAESVIMFANDTTGPTSEDCRTAIFEPTLKSTAAKAKVEDVQRSTYTTKDGRTLLTASYFIPKFGDAPVQQENVYAFIGDPRNCAEIHLSKVRYKPEDRHLFDLELDLFKLEADYAPQPIDYFGLATLLFKTQQSPDQAAVYYQRALDTLPESAPLEIHRVIVDQLSMSYGMAGDLKRSRSTNEAAIAKDPAYPLYYYNLACADAESGDATAAKAHLQQAFDRRANVIKGETMPDPSKDDSILKLKSNKLFWDFVQRLPKS